MLVRNFKIGLLAAMVTFSGWAKPAPTLVQTRYSAQVQVQDMGSISTHLDKLCRECQAQITNLNCDLNSANGNLNVRVPEEKLGRFCEGLRNLGQVRSENRSSSDNTSSYADAQRNLEMAEKTLSAEWSVRGGQLSPIEKGLVDAEFKAYLRDRINSYRNTISNYEQNQGFAEVNVSLSSTAAPSEPVRRRTRNRPQALETTQIEVIAEPEKLSVARPAANNMALLGPAAVMLALIAFFVVKQRSRPTSEN